MRQRFDRVSLDRLVAESVQQFVQQALAKADLTAATLRSGTAQAKHNLDLELASGDTLESVRDRAQTAWDKKLKTVEWVVLRSHVMGPMVINERIDHFYAHDSKYDNHPRIAGLFHSATQIGARQAAPSRRRAAAGSGPWVCSAAASVMGATSGRTMGRIAPG